MRDFPRRLTAALLFGLLALCVYRARTQSLTIDEALVFQRFVSQPLGEMARSFDACNHVLHTLLMKFCEANWGIAEVVLRVPTLLGAALYFVAVYRITWLLFPGWRQPLAAALLTMHPLVLDLLVAARGYGLALGLFAWALDSAIRYHMQGYRTGRLNAAGIFAGLSVAANLTFAVPVAALGGTLLLMRRRGVFDAYFGPALVFAAVFLILPLSRATAQSFAAGSPVLPHSVSSRFLWTVKSESAPFAALALEASSWLAPLIVWGTAIAVAAWTVRALLRRDHTRFDTAPLVLAGGTLTLSLGIAAAIGLAGLPLPEGRTSLYLIPLGALAPALLLRKHLWVALVVVVFYACQTHNSYFTEWRFDAGTRDMLRRLDEDRVRQGEPAPVTVAVAPALFKTAEYYKLRRKTPWLDVKPLSEPSSRYVLLDGSRNAATPELTFDVVARHDLSGQSLLRRKR